MRKLHYKGRCTKRKLSKCKDICRTYDAIQTSFAEWLQENDEISSFQCNVKIENDSEDQYTSDFYAEKKDGTMIVRECVWRKNLSRPTTARLLDISRNYWMSKNVEDCWIRYACCAVGKRSLSCLCAVNSTRKRMTEGTCRKCRNF